MQIFNSNCFEGSLEYGMPKNAMWICIKRGVLIILSQDSNSRCAQTATHKKVTTEPLMITVKILSTFTGDITQMTSTNQPYETYTITH
jgi:hypothetical protein